MKTKEKQKSVEPDPKPLIPEPEPEPKKDSPPQAAAFDFGQAEKPNDWPKDYRERFWAVYPRRTEKKSALAKLDAVKKSGAVPWAQFEAGLVRYRDHVAGTEERFIKHPTTWLNRGCWDDETAAPGKGPRAPGGNGFASLLRQRMEPEGV